MYLGENNDLITIHVELFNRLSEDNFGFAVGVYLWSVYVSSRLRNKQTSAVSKALIPFSYLQLMRIIFSQEDSRSLREFDMLNTLFLG